jgi:hypothetical protein
MSDLHIGQRVWAHFNRWTPDGWVPVIELATVVNPCVENDPDYAGEVEIKTEGTINREFSPRALLQPVDEPSTPSLIEAAEAVLASPSVAPYRLISPFKELAAAIAQTRGADQ